MKIKYGLSIIALAALVGGGAPAMAQQNNPPTDPTEPSGAHCTGFPGDPVSCTQTNPNQPNTVIPEDPNAPDINTQSGQPDIQGTPDMENQQQLPSGGATPDNDVRKPVP